MKPNIMPSPMSVNAVGKPSMITITISMSIVRPRAGSLTFGSPRSDALVRGLVDLVGAFDRALARFHRAVEEVAAHVRVLRERIGAGHHEERAVQHVVEVEDPCRGRVEDVALEDLDAHREHQDHDQPGDGLADPGADVVRGDQDALDSHGSELRAGPNGGLRKTSTTRARPE